MGRFEGKRLMVTIQSRKRTRPSRDPVADAGAPVDGGDEREESQHGEVSAAGVGLEGLVWGSRGWCRGGGRLAGVGTMG